MLWAFLSLLAAFIWASANVIKKHVVSRLIEEPIVPVIFLGVFGILAGFIVYFVRGFAYLTSFQIFLGILSGLSYIISMILFLKAMKIEEVSRVVPLLYLHPLFVALLASIFLGEVLTPLKYLGVISFIAGAILISSKGSIDLNFGKTFWLMIASAFALSTYAVIMKHLLNYADFWTVFSWIRFGAVPLLIPIIYFYRFDLLRLWKENKKKAASLITLAESLNLGGIVLITIATSLGFVTLVNTLTSSQPFFVLLLTTFLSIFYPKILQEEVERRAVVKKIIAIALIFLGAVLIT